MDIVTIAIAVAAIAILVSLFNMFLPDGSKALQKKFVSMGNMSGKSLHDIVKVAGNFKIMKALPDGKAYTWSAPKYAITLAFDKSGHCTKVLAEVVK